MPLYLIKMFNTVLKIVQVGIIVSCNRLESNGRQYEIDYQ